MQFLFHLMYCHITFLLFLQGSRVNPDRKNKHSSHAVRASLINWEPIKEVPCSITSVSGKRANQPKLRNHLHNDKEHFKSCSVRRKDRKKVWREGMSEINEDVSDIIGGGL